MDESQPFVFLSYSRDDNEFVARLRTDLEAQGISVWIDKEAIQPGKVEWDEALRTALRGCQAVVVIVSPNARSSRYIKGELRAAEAYGRPIYAVWASGSEWIEVIPLISLSGMQYVDAREPHYDEALPQLVAVLKGTALAKGLDSEHAEEYKPAVEPHNPYKGLQAFTPADQRYFFGRARLIQKLVEALKESMTSDKTGGKHARLLAIVGPSGSRKSSVVLAGLLPRLQQGLLQEELPGSQEWIYLEPIVPGRDPIEALIPVLAEKLPDRDFGVLRKDLGDSSASGLRILAKMLTKSSQKRVVLVIDQFEELLTQTTSEDKRQQMIDLLMVAITEPGGAVIVILTLSADFYDRPMRYPDLYQLIKDCQQEVLPMEMDELRAVIEQPAKLPDVQLSFEDNLVGDLLFEMKGQMGALPLLQFTLDQLFQRRSGRRLTIAAYREMGGVKRALAKYAESIYTSLPSEEYQRLARALFLRLIDPGVTEQDTTRRRATLTELQVPDAQKTAMLEQVVQKFITARLLTTTTVGGVATTGTFLVSKLFQSSGQPFNPSLQSPNLPLPYSYLGNTDLATCVAWSPDGIRIVSASEDKTVQVRDATTGAHFFSYTRHRNYVNSAAWSPDGERNSSASLDGTVQVWLMLPS